MAHFHHCYKSRSVEILLLSSLPAFCADKFERGFVRGLKTPLLEVSFIPNRFSHDLRPGRKRGEGAAWEKSRHHYFCLAQ